MPTDLLYSPTDADLSSRQAPLPDVFRRVRSATHPGPQPARALVLASDELRSRRERGWADPENASPQIPFTTGVGGSLC